ncbi:FkbM family methyltransferase [Spirosoma rhododendri]|uniref:FkbM family methyltransferase n=1 Tax=Spirosoma rhododendri TaxID=2728024 RepID=A0A7L5DSY5_9BACT|nr:FkbM family methyltransferase [Spirosoma rhododendri]QJD79698.1 FkbM family methyltransferase [Spirosoma rhododendri]
MNLFKRKKREEKVENPYSKFLSDEDYQQLIKTDRFTVGKLKFLGNNLEYSDAPGFLHSLQELFIDEVYSFIPETENPIIVDCGSNIGLSIIYFKQRFPNAKIIGFEPDAAIYKLLENNLKSFNLMDVQIHNAAVWTEDTELDFYAEGSLAGSTEINYANASDNKYKVAAIDLKKILSSNQVEFLKMDIEGAENTVLPDLANLIDSIPYVFLEYHGMLGKPQQLGAMLNMLSSAGFRYNIQAATEGVKHPFYEVPKHGFENQLNIFCKKSDEHSGSIRHVN